MQGRLETASASVARGSSIGGAVADADVADSLRRWRTAGPRNRSRSWGSPARAACRGGFDGDGWRRRGRCGDAGLRIWTTSPETFPFCFSPVGLDRVVFLSSEKETRRKRRENGCPKWPKKSRLKIPSVSLRVLVVVSLMEVSCFFVFFVGGPL